MKQAETDLSAGASPLTLAEWIDEACDRFEAQWRAGAAPRIELYLDEISVPGRPVAPPRACSPRQVRALRRPLAGSSCLCSPSTRKIPDGRGRVRWRFGGHPGGRDADRRRCDLGLSPGPTHGRRRRPADDSRLRDPAGDRPRRDGNHLPGPPDPRRPARRFEDDLDATTMAAPTTCSASASKRRRSRDSTIPTSSRSTKSAQGTRVARLSRWNTSRAEAWPIRCAAGRPHPVRRRPWSRPWPTPSTPPTRPASSTGT